MKILSTIICILLTNFTGFAQLECYPRIGDIFNPIHQGVNLRLEPSLTSEIILKSPGNGGVANMGIRLICMQDGFTNDFVKVKVLFWNYTMGDFGINKNLEYLFDKLKENHSYNESFATFYHEMQDTNKAINTYYQIKSDEWVQDWSNAEDYDMSTFKSFFKYWIAGKGSTDSINYILKNHERILYVHKSVIESSGYVLTLVGPDVGVDYYTRKLEEFQKLYEENSCQFSSTAIYTHLEALIEILFAEKKYFDAIKKINLFEQYLKTEKEKYQILNLKMQASYFDDNINGALDIGQNLIRAYKNKIITNKRAIYNGDLDMSTVYGISISCFLKLERFQEAILLSRECLQNESLQYPQYIEFHAAVLVNLGKVDEACKFLNDAYMKGDENARKVYLEYCK